MPPDGKFDPDSMTDVQHAFWSGLTDQRVANMWEAADYIADLSDPAKDFLRNADEGTLHWLERAEPEDIDRLKYNIKFTEAVRLVSRFWFWLIATGVGAAVAFFTLWEKVSAVFRTKQ